MSQVATVRPAPGTTPRNGLPAPRHYIYRGVGVDTLTAELDDIDTPELDEQFGPDEAPWPCGTPLGYYRGCRCRSCKDAQAARKCESRQRRQAAS